MTKVFVDTPWRKTSIALYKPPADSRIFGTSDIDVTKTLKFIEKENKKGRSITLTQFLVNAIGVALQYDVPEINAYVRRGHVLHRGDADVFVSVFIPETKEVSGYIIREAGKKSALDISDEMNSNTEKYRGREEGNATKNKYFLAKLPWPFRRWIVLLIRFITVTLGFAIKPLKIDASSFGGIMLSNLGVVGLRYGFAALFPVSTVSTVLIMGVVDRRPVVRNNKIVIRDMLPMSATLDHRIVDGAVAGKLSQALDRYLQHPEYLASIGTEKEVKRPEKT